MYVDQNTETVELAGGVALRPPSESLASQMLRSMVMRYNMAVGRARYDGLGLAGEMPWTDRVEAALLYFMVGSTPPYIAGVDSHEVLTQMLAVRARRVAGGR